MVAIVSYNFERNFMLLLLRFGGIIASGKP
jgi:hypothetical protein